MITFEFHRRLTRLLLFLAGGFLLASPGLVPAQQSADPEIVLQIGVPRELGEIERMHHGGGRTVVYIQDAHGRQDAQRKIYELLKHLERTFGFKAIFLEGTLGGKIAERATRVFDDTKLNRLAARFLLERGAIGGPEAYVLESEGGIDAYGTEAPELFEENLRLLQKVHGAQAVSKQFLDGARMFIQQMSKRPQAHAAQQTAVLAADVKLLEKLFSLYLTRADYEKLGARKTMLLPSVLLERLHSLTEGVPELEQAAVRSLDALFQEALQFYETSCKRESAIFENVLAVLDETDAEKAVLVTGGFHASGLEALMEQKGLSFVSIKPRVDNFGSNRYYLMRLASYSPSVSALAPRALGEKCVACLRQMTGKGYENCRNGSGSDRDLFS